MIFLIAAAALGMGGIVAYLAREKGRSPLTWGVYGTVAAPIALPHILLVGAHDDEDGDVWAEIRDAIQTQSVNDQRPIVGTSGRRPAVDPQDRPEPAAAPRAAMKPEPKPDLNPAPKPDIKAEPRAEPKHDMFADKRSTPGQNAQTRAEPSFAPAQSSTPQKARGAANDFTLNASDRIGAPFTAQPSAQNGDGRSRAPLSVDPNAGRAQSRPIAGRLFAAGAAAVAIAAGFFVLGPTLARMVPPELAFWSKPAVTEVKNTAPSSVGNGAGLTPSGTPSAATPAAPNESPFAATTPEAKEVGAVRTPEQIKSNTKAPAYTGSSAAPTDLAAATRNMKPVDVPEETKSETPKAETKAATPAPKAAAVTPAPKSEAPKAAAKPTETAKLEAPKKVEAPKAEAPKAAAQAAPPEDFLAMVNKAITTGTTPQPARATTETDKVEQVSAANDLVQSVQVKLRERGYDPGSIDGRTTPKTVQAIRDYQQSIGMTADGLIDVALMERLGVVGKRLQFPTGR